MNTQEEHAHQAELARQKEVVAKARREAAEAKEEAQALAKSTSEAEAVTTPLLVAGLRFIAFICLVFITPSIVEVLTETLGGQSAIHQIYCLLILIFAAVVVKR